MLGAEPRSEGRRPRFALFRLPGLISAVRCGERKPGGTSHHLALLVREHSFEAVGVDDLFPLVRRHSPQVIDGLVHHASTIGRKLLHLAEDLSRLLLLFRSQVLPCLHAVQHAQLLLRRKTREMLKPLAE